MSWRALASEFKSSTLRNTWWGHVMSVPFMAYVAGYVVPLEESYLESKFPDTWRHYASKTQRWGFF